MTKKKKKKKQTCPWFLQQSIKLGSFFLLLFFWANAEGVGLACGGALLLI